LVTCPQCDEDFLCRALKKKKKSQVAGGNRIRVPGSGQRPPRPQGMRSDEIDYEIFGEDMQIIEVTLDPGETVIAEPGLMCYMDRGIKMEAKMSDGSTPNEGGMSKLVSAAKRAATGENLFVAHFSNVSNSRRMIGLSAPYPGRIIPMDLKELGGRVIVQCDAFIAAARGTKIDFTMTKSWGKGPIKVTFGEFFMQELIGDGLAFVHAGGLMIERQLEGETLVVDSGSVVAMTRGIEHSFERTGSIKSSMFGGEGFFITTLKGTGTVWLQSMPFSRLANKIASASIGVG
jgi:uncharacterized protein (TIGR00266 family)